VTMAMSCFISIGTPWLGCMDPNLWIQEVAFSRCRTMKSQNFDHIHRRFTGVKAHAYGNTVPEMHWRVVSFRASNGLIL
jgi:hypothetical protein